jgi:hypothetical protein
MVDDASCPGDPLSGPSDPRLNDRLLAFEEWFEQKRAALQKRSAEEKPRLRSLAKELQAEVE